MTAVLELDAVTHRYGDELAVEDVSFEVEAGEVVALLGPSGCGKTTLVQAIAGHVRPTAGRVVLRGEDVTDVRPESRHVGVVFQQSTLFPHMTVGENVAYGLAARDVPSDRRSDLVREYLALVELDDQRESYPAELSGGQQRRVELARAVAPRPDVLLLDEPLSALDRTLRHRLRDEIARIQRETGVTMLCVTHDQEEAMALADRLAVVNDGQIDGIGRPRALYESPPTPFVAAFLGRTNSLTGVVLDQQHLTVDLAGQEVTLAGVDTTFPAGTPITCHVRPEDASLRVGAADGTEPSLPVEVVDVADVGRRYDVTVRVGSGEELVVEQPRNPPVVGESLTVEFPPERLALFETERKERVTSRGRESPRARHRSDS